MQDGMRSDWPWICVGVKTGRVSKDGTSYIHNLLFISNLYINNKGLACVSYWRFLRRWIAKLRTKHGYVGRCGERLNDGRK